ncbi:hypothetical protein [Sphingomonas arenae]|uniref:hypothetical protein n=1 Tax=Sphingomonas arenae TaxID=2812555 RepID=UPI0019684460|nr:hypothetical protein [Sphingomonas arenae]
MLLVLLAVQASPDLARAASREVARQECRLREKADEVVVCGRRDAQRRYQVTDPNAPFDPSGPVDSVARERSRWVEEGDVGTQSCSAVGPGGWTGCAVKQWKRARQQHKGWYQ